MGDRFEFIRLPALLLLIFFFGKLIVGAAGGSYELGIRLFAMVPLTVHLALVWGALSKVYRGEKIGGAMLSGIAIAFVAQVLIVVGTLGSTLLGAETHFNNPVAIVGEVRGLSFGEQVFQRGGALIVNCIIGAVAAAIGYALARLIPVRAVGAP